MVCAAVDQLEPACDRHQCRVEMNRDGSGRGRQLVVATVTKKKMDLDRSEGTGRERACHFVRHCLQTFGLRDSELKLDLAGPRKRPRLVFSVGVAVFRRHHMDQCVF